MSLPELQHFETGNSVFQAPTDFFSSTDITSGISVLSKYTQISQYLFIFHIDIHFFQTLGANLGCAHLQAAKNPRTPPCVAFKMYFCLTCEDSLPHSLHILWVLQCTKPQMNVSLTQRSHWHQSKFLISLLLIWTQGIPKRHKATLQTLTWFLNQHTQMIPPQPFFFFIEPMKCFCYTAIISTNHMMQQFPK